MRRELGRRGAFADGAVATPVLVMAVTGECRPRPRVLLLAHACSPERGSEPGVGWNRAVESAKQFDTWVICQDRYVRDIRRYLEAHGRIPGLTFEVVPKSAIQRLLARIPGFYYVAYNLWHRRAFGIARRLHERIHFDLVHQVTFCGFREPGYLWKLDVPFLWGPVGGTQNYPWRFLGEAGIRGAMSEALRTLINRAQLRLSVRVRRAARKAGAVLAANSTNQRDVARVHGITPMLLLETGLSGVATTPRTGRPEGGELRILWVGELRPFKGLSLLIKALADLPEDVPFELRVVGDGPAKSRWQALARKTGVERRATWMGWLPHAEALQQYSWADVLVFTSLRDTSGNVVLEALGAGVPVICLDHQGVHDIVTGQCGVKVPVTVPHDVIAGLSRATAALARDPIQREQMSRAALERAREYLWSRQGERMAALYRQLLQGRCGRASTLNSAAEDASRAEVDSQPPRQTVANRLS